MYEVLTYPVSGIMKAWHLLIHHFVPDSTAWLICIPLLVITVRSLIAPLTWMSVRSGRLAVLMRPEMLAITARKRAATTVEELTAAQEEERALKQRYKYRPAVGCVPPLIMIPVFLGLYQVLLRMAAPRFGTTIGMLNGEEVQAFRATEFLGIPLPAYVSMPHATAQSLGVTGAEVRSVITPWLIGAIIFTTVNMLISLHRGFLTTKFDDALPRRLFYFLVIMTCLVPFMLWHAAMAAPVPTAIIVYWACTNLYTLLQTIVIEILLRTRYPLRDEHHQMRRESIAALRTKQPKLTRAEKKQRKEELKARRKEHQALVDGARKQQRAKKKSDG